MSIPFGPSLPPISKYETRDANDDFIIRRANNIAKIYAIILIIRPGHEWLVGQEENPSRRASPPPFAVREGRERKTL